MLKRCSILLVLLAMFCTGVGCETQVVERRGWNVGQLRDYGPAPTVDVQRERVGVQRKKPGFFEQVAGWFDFSDDEDPTAGYEPVKRSPPTGMGLPTPESESQ